MYTSEYKAENENIFRLRIQNIFTYVYIGFQWTFLSPFLLLSSHCLRNHKQNTWIKFK